MVPIHNGILFCYNEINENMKFIGKCVELVKIVLSDITQTRKIKADCLLLSVIPGSMVSDVNLQHGVTTETMKA